MPLLFMLCAMEAANAAVAVVHDASTTATEGDAYVDMTLQIDGDYDRLVLPSDCVTNWEMLDHNTVRIYLVSYCFGDLTITYYAILGDIASDTADLKIFINKKPPAFQESTLPDGTIAELYKGKLHIKYCAKVQNCSYSIEGLPSGIGSSRVDDVIRITGIPEEYGKFNLKISVLKELPSGPPNPDPYVFYFPLEIKNATRKPQIDDVLTESAEFNRESEIQYDLNTDFMHSLPTSLGISQQPAHGKLRINGLHLLYKPIKDYKGSDSFSFYSENSAGKSNIFRVKIRVIHAIYLVMTHLPSVKVGTKVSLPITLLYAQGPVSFEPIPDLPEGIQLDTKTRRFVGTPKKSGSYRFFVSVEDALGAVTGEYFSIKILSDDLYQTVKREMDDEFSSNVMTVGNGNIAARLEDSYPLAGKDLVTFASQVRCQSPSHGSIWLKLFMTDGTADTKVLDDASGRDGEAIVSSFTTNAKGSFPIQSVNLAQMYGVAAKKVIKPTIYYRLDSDDASATCTLSGASFHSVYKD